ncbi:MAG: hypothetical protein ACJ8AT_31510 [Hyalangium sp.]|uniref:hypothetical protein n=1 Tax=Hyalangium sp. TaxID=2028555 RepID=UPI00389A2DEC
MTQEMQGLLLEDRWAPVTSTMGFLELAAEQAAQAYATWQRGLMTPRAITVDELPVTGTDYLRHLGLSPFEEDFYMPPGTRAWLIQKTGPFATGHKEYTLEEARAARVL